MKSVKIAALMAALQLVSSSFVLAAESEDEALNRHLDRKMISQLLSAKRSILFWSYHRIKNRRSETDSKLFDSSPSIFELVEKTRFEIPREQPCIDANGNPADFSLVGKTPDSICISLKKLRSFRLEVEDLQEDDLHPFVLYLLALRLGVEPAEAERLQGELLRAKVALRGRSTRYFPSPDYVLEFRWFFYGLTDLFDELKRFTTLDRSCEITRQFEENNLLHAYKNSSDIDFYYLPPQYEAQFWSFYVKFSVLRTYLCSVDPQESPESRARMTALYRSIFNGKEQVSAPGLPLEHADQASADFVSHRIHGPWDLPENFKTFYEVVRKLNRSYGEFYYSGFESDWKE